MPASVKLLVLMLLLAAAGGAVAETTRWVADDLKVAVRSGPSLQHRIFRFVESGTPMAVLAQDEETGYSQVRTPDGTEGWMLTEQLMDRRGARERLEQAEGRIQSLEDQRGQLRERVAGLEAELKALQGEKAGVDEALARSRGELAELRQVAAEPIAVAEENQGLKQALADEQEKTRLLVEEVRTLRDRSLKEWFLIGAGVSLGSLFLGLVIPRIRWRRRGWDDFR